MTLRTKTMGITFVVLVALFAILYLAIQAILLDSFARLEQQELGEDVQRVLNALDARSTQLETTLFDWAYWDDTYQFVQDGNQDYIDSNLMDSVFDSQKINVMVFINTTGQVVYSKAFNLASKQVVEPSAVLLGYLQPDGLLSRSADDASALTGIIALPEGPMLITSEPILTSMEQGPAVGRLVFGQYLNDPVIQQISDDTFTSLKIFPINGQLPKDVVNATEHLTTGSAIYVHPLNNNMVGGYAILSDVNHDPSYILRVNASRFVFHQGQNSLTYLALAMLLAGVVSCGVLLYVLDRFVLGRLARLSRTLALMRGEEGRTMRVQVDGGDEIGALAHSFNEALQALEQSRESLHSNQTLLAKVFDSVPAAISITNLREGRMLSVNPYLLELVGAKAEDVEQKLVYKDGFWASLDQRAELIEELEKTGAVSGREVLWKTKAGKPVHLLFSMQTIEVNGEPCMLGIGIDITNRKQAELERLEASRLRIEVEKEREVVELKERFISTMSHEFRTPLAIIQSSKETLQHYYDRMTPERRVEKLNTIGEQIARIVEMLDDFLTISKSRAGKLAFNPETLNIVTLSQKLLEQLQTVDHSTHHFEFMTEGEPGAFYGDERLLQHILINLLSNAIKYSPDGGRIGFALRQVDGNVVIEVSDEGIGIPEKDQKHLFEAFYRASNTYSIQGTGLGLAIVNESVKAHGGTISCTSAQGKGSTFTVRLPLRKEALQAATV